MQNSEHLLSVKEAAELLSIGERAVQKNAMAGRYGALEYRDGVRCQGGKMIMIRLSSLPEAVQSAYYRRHNIIEEPERPAASAYDRADAAARETANER